MARTAVPDFLSVGVGFTGIAGPGGGSSIEANWVLRGPEASFYLQSLQPKVLELDLTLMLL